jgi:pimeloyl-ACP methyl ester carboxylesterase
MGNYIQTASGLLHWRDYGGSGEVIVLVHGLGGSVANWDAVGPRLADMGRTVALDLPGFGLSPPARDWELDTHAGAVEAFIAEFGPSATLVGNSMGGLLSEMVASRAPETVDSLVLVAPATPPRLPDPRIHWPTARRLALQATPVVGRAMSRRFLKRLTPEELVKLSLETITHNPSRVSMSLVEEFVKLAGVRVGLPWAEEAIPDTGRSIARMFRKPSSFVTMIRGIKTPTLVVHGLEDRIVSPTAVEWLCSLRPDWQFVQMQDTGHVPQLDAPIRFLDTIAPWLQASLKREITA